MIEAPCSTGQVITKPNPAIKELRDTSKSMLAILKQLGLNIDTVRVPDDDDL
jgi:phage terminase small subunit